MIGTLERGEEHGTLRSGVYGAGRRSKSGTSIWSSLVSGWMDNLRGEKIDLHRRRRLLQMMVDRDLRDLAANWSKKRKSKVKMRSNRLS